ncbi:unnamed protein product [Kuraishia capsulata CBS 1993]|uniref:Major facilitator superfamily (MFS) profile domain-containing protein n=1 Tax=Kuraishia capsulata CBS 1993 TaxID=1382522 RepID=W6MML5_9ASCO|nr:uncharacterized protein KUCA_T00003426001 [Kuraishia capsulata CBS 1993]CDK27448.1 unnamed protein product [Kuraishia capsulata CBS 1993]
MAPNTKKGGNAAFHDFVEDFAHIDDPLERRRLALAKIDEAKFSWYHVRAIMVGGVGFLTDSYDIFAINLAVTMLAYVFWGSKYGGTGVIPDSTATLLKVATSVGTVIGQLCFGKIADTIGRQKIYGAELSIMIVATIFQVCIGESPAINFVAMYTFWRIIMGIGIGADYPLSSIITSEFATTRNRGAIMGAVFANQGWGQLLAGIVSIVCVRAWKSDLEGAANATECVGDCVKAIDQMWRVLVGLGAVPGCFALYFRLTIPESPRYNLSPEEVELQEDNKDISASGEIEVVNAKNTKNKALTEEDSFSAKNVEVEAPTGPATIRDFYDHFKQWKHGKILLGTAGSWFMLDIAFYGLNLNSAVILEAIGFASKKNVYDHLYNVCCGNLILICAGSLPGYWFSVALVDRIGRKPIQIGGFIILTGLFCAIGFAYDKLGKHGLLALYVLAQFFQNFGPNATTYIVPAECFPTRFRSTAHGISAASGKVGAIVAQTALGTLINHGCAADNQNCWLPHVMEIFALFMLLGIFTSLLIPETKRQTLEDLAERLHGELSPETLARIKAERNGSSSGALEV